MVTSVEISTKMYGDLEISPEILQGHSSKMFMTLQLKTKINFLMSMDFFLFKDYSTVNIWAKHRFLISVRNKNCIF